MCGIFAVLSEPAGRGTPAPSQIEARLADALAAMRPGSGKSKSRSIDDLRRATDELVDLDSYLCRVSGMRTLVTAAGLVAEIEARLTDIEEVVIELEAGLDSGRVLEGASIEDLNRVLVGLRDALWSLGHDRIRTARAVVEMLDGVSCESAIDAYVSVQMALSAIDRLEVRGRDSAGISLLVHGHGLTNEELHGLASVRHDSLFLNGAVEIAEQTAVFVYKAAAEIGALGDNVAQLRAAIVRDSLLRQLLARDGARVTIVSHTRWASVGTVSEPNAHPVDSQEINSDGPYVIASLNGDVDNFVELGRAGSISCAEEITTDAKVIPTLFSRGISRSENADIADTFRSVVAGFDGSVAIVAAVANQPDRLLLAVRGSGQGCYVGFADNAFLVASEPYGLVEQCDTYLRIDGETPSSISGKNGQVVELIATGAGTLQSLRRLSYGGEELPVAESELVQTEITTRDIDRGDAAHFLLKEISESPESVRRTLRGKISGSSGRLNASLDEASFPVSIRKALAERELTQVIAIGQGTASVASRSIANVLDHVAPARIAVSVCPATELSGFGLRDDMSDTLVVAVSQSGTTTDTNRTVDLVRSRGAKVIAIVNRRESDLTGKADGVLYTSNGRDVEMSVASTKAFYAQVVAGTLLGVAIAEAVGVGDRRQIHELLDGLKQLPDAMTKVLAKRDKIAVAARAHAPSRRWWAMVGNGSNHIAAQELRIKMSELCYKSIACDVTEDKKHIDLSSEPMIFVCAAGITDSMANDIAKEVAIYNAHKALPIVICSEGTRFDAPSVITVPLVHPKLDFVFSTMAGHLFGYEAALAIDEQGHLMRATRAILDDVLAHSSGDEDAALEYLRTALDGQARKVLLVLNSDELNGHLTSSTAVRLGALLRCAVGSMTLDALEVEYGRQVSPLSMMRELMTTLSLAVDELTRPIDAVKHQAKTVTVGISRAEESFADNVLINAVVGAGSARETLSYRNSRLLSALVPAITRITGYTRYEVSGDVGARTATSRVIAKGGVAASIPSRSETDPRLSGTKHRAAYERTVTVARGGRDGRSVVIVPETRDTRTIGIVLLHVDFQESLSAELTKDVLTGYRGRYAALVDAVTETEPDFDDAQLGEIAILNLLVDPVRVLADKWRRPHS